VSGYPFPLLRQAGLLRFSPGYDLAEDNYVVVDANGIVRYTSQAHSNRTAVGRYRENEVRAALDAALRDAAPSPVAPGTWTAVRQLYRAR